MSLPDTDITLTLTLSAGASAVPDGALPMWRRRVFVLASTKVGQTNNVGEIGVKVKRGRKEKKKKKKIYNYLTSRKSKRYFNAKQSNTAS